jgi:hypothetical protein
MLVYAVKKCREIKSSGVSKMHSSAPYRWDSLDKSILQKNAKLVKTLSYQSIKEIVIENCQRYLEFYSITPQSISIEEHPLLGVDGAVIVVNLEEYPSEIGDNGSFRLAGMARLIKVDAEILPVVLMFPHSNQTTLEHECIHLCQLLNNQTYLLTLAERIALFYQNKESVLKDALSKNPENALSLLIKIVCYKVWMELEAQYYLNDKTTEHQRRILCLAQRSSLPFTTFEQILFKWDLSKMIPNAMSKCQKAFTLFCEDLSSQVEWVRYLISKSGSETLNEALWWCKEEDEMEMMFGSIEDDDDDDYAESHAANTKAYEEYAKANGIDLMALDEED